jgi:hypothetical protein
MIDLEILGEGVFAVIAFVVLIGRDRFSDFLVDSPAAMLDNGRLCFGLFEFLFETTDLGAEGCDGGG